MIATIELGVLFVMAFWSGYSRKAFAELKRVLAEHDPNGKLELVVVDIGGCSDVELTPEFHSTIQGYGETAWIKNGKVVRTSGAGYHPECYEGFTRELLQ